MPERPDPFTLARRVKNTAAKGRRNEHRPRAILEAAGYRVIRAAGSLGEWDLVGLGPRGVIVVQVKTRDWPGTLEMDSLRESCGWRYITRLVHRYRDGIRLPDVREL